jgi:hypothetical protein
MSNSLSAVHPELVAEWYIYLYLPIQKKILR